MLLYSMLPKLIAKFDKFIDMTRYFDSSSYFSCRWANKAKQLQRQVQCRNQYLRTIAVTIVGEEIRSQLNLNSNIVHTSSTYTAHILLSFKHILREPEQAICIVSCIALHLVPIHGCSQTYVQRKIIHTQHCFSNNPESTQKRTSCARARQNLVNLRRPSFTFDKSFASILQMSSLAFSACASSRAYVHRAIRVRLSSRNIANVFLRSVSWTSSGKFVMESLYFSTSKWQFWYPLARPRDITGNLET